MVCEIRQKPELPKDGFMGALLPQFRPPPHPAPKTPLLFLPFRQKHCDDTRFIMVVFFAVVFVIVIPVLIVFFVFFATVVIIVINRPGVARAVLQTPLFLIDLLIKLVIIFLQTS